MVSGANWIKGGREGETQRVGLGGEVVERESEGGGGEGEREVVEREGGGGEGARERDVEREGGGGAREGGGRWRERVREVVERERERWWRGRGVMERERVGGGGEREPCAMTMSFLPPTLIAEVIMYWEGFESSKKLVQKMSQTYKLCWGQTCVLRAVSLIPLFYIYLSLCQKVLSVTPSLFVDLPCPA